MWKVGPCSSRWDSAISSNRSSVLARAEKPSRCPRLWGEAKEKESARVGDNPVLLVGVPAHHPLLVGIFIKEELFFKCH